MELIAYLFGVINLIICFSAVIGDVIEMREDDFKPLFKTAASEFSHHEIVKPVIYKGDKQLQSTKDKTGHHSQITLKFYTAENVFILDLIRNRNLFTKSYVEKSVNSETDYKLRRPYHKKLQKHCFYHGHVRGVPDSMVAVSTCNGVCGYIQTGRQVFHIEPAFDIDRFSHRLFRDEHSLNTQRKCGAHNSGRALKLNSSIHIEYKNDVLKRMKRSVKQPYDANMNTRYVEMYVVNDFRTYDSNGRNEQYQIRKTQNIINIVSRLYQPFNIYVALVGIENWIKTDLFTITTEADTTLENFLHYRKSRINPKHQNDNAQLITGTTFGNGVVGKAIKGTICTFQYSGGVNLNLATEGQTATTIAHELGHNFGMDHDNYTICQCKEDKCIMAATSGGSRDNRINTPTQWSSCSMLALQEAFEMGMDYCLRNLPEQLYEGPVCGNGFTEDEEECDCGLPEDCANKCCNASTCRLTVGSSCATGACCDLNKCKPKAAATLCRPNVGNCDLPEFCLGNSPACPADVYVKDGTECYSGGQSYCYNGQCRTHTGQCKLLWGNTGRVSDPVCFRHLNTEGTKNGNCGYNWTRNTYEPCQRDDVMCGLLHCVHQNEKLMFWKDNLAHATPATFLTIGPQTYVCRGAMLDVGLDMPDPGMVPDGAKCDDRKICVNNKCTAISSLKFPSCNSGCSDRGVCNSKGHCHCEEGWGGSTCDEAGNGGSVDSGPIKISDDKSLLIGLLVFFLVVVPLLGVLAFIAYYFRANFLAWWHNKFSFKHKDQKRPLRPARPPPKREHSPVRHPPRPPAADAKPKISQQPVRPLPPPTNNNNNNRPGLSVKVSDPVLTGTTHNDTKTHVRPSPVPSHKPVIPKPPLKPNKGASNNTEGKPAAKNDTPPADKSRFAPIFKIPSFSKSDKQSAQNPKPEVSKTEEVPAPNIVKKRELTRNISNPVLISTTDRRSKHLVKLDNLNLQSDGEDTTAPPVPPKISLANEYENTTRRNRPLPAPPRPASMPESECGDDLDTGGKGNRKSAVIVTRSQSPRMPLRPPPPPVKPNVENTRKMLEDELSKLDDINVEIPRDSPDRQLPGYSSSPSIKPKNVKPKPPAAAAKSSDKKPFVLSKAPANKTKSDSKLDPPKWGEKEKPIFNPKARPGLSSNKTNKGKGKADTRPGNETVSLKPGEPNRKPSTESLEDDPSSGAASVAGLTQRFEVQKKPLLSDRNVKRTQVQGGAKAPMTPPKPRSGAKQIRSIDV